MTEYSGPFASAGTGLEEADWLRIEDIIYPYSGYVKDYANELEVIETTPLAGMNVMVKTGAAVLKSSRFYNSAVQTITIDALADPAKDRIDTIVVQRTLADPASTITITVHKGAEAAAGTAVAPTLTDAGGVYEIGLADVFVEHGEVAIHTADITDKRISTKCGMYYPKFGPLTVLNASGNLDAGGYKLTNLAAPTTDSDADTYAARVAALAALDTLPPTSTADAGMTILVTSGSTGYELGWPYYRASVGTTTDSVVASSSNVTYTSTASMPGVGHDVVKAVSLPPYIVASSTSAVGVYFKARKNTSDAVRYQLAVNGEKVGTEDQYSASTNYLTVSTDIVGVRGGDQIQVYGATGSAGTVDFQDLFVCFTLTRSTVLGS